MKKLTQQTKIRLTVFVTSLTISVLSPSFGFDTAILSAQEVAEAPLAGTEDAQDSLQQLLEQLDSPSFKEREAATEKLVELGPNILKPLTVHFFESSSEAGWRIHRILEDIGKNGEEKDFLKSIAIIQLLFGAQDSQSQARLTELQYQWKTARRAEAARKLGKLGFRFTAQSGIAPRDAALERARIEMMVRAAAVRELGGVEIAVAPNPNEVATTAEAASPVKWENPREKRQESILKIEKIIANDSADNKSIVEGLLPPSTQVTLSPGTLEIPKDWEANEDTLKLIGDLSTLSNLTFRNQKIDASLKEFISNQKLLIGLGLVDCEFEEGENKLSLPPSITNLQFEGSLPPPSSFTSLKQLNALQLKNVNLDEDAAYAISRCQVQIIHLEEVEFTRKSIRQLIDTRGLFRLTMSLCKFELEWLEEVRRKNPRLISASPKAFLGVKGLTDISGGDGLSGCQISDVVPDTAAAEAGMQSMDIVTAMDGTKISRFEDLRLLISQKRPGESMEVTVQRGAESKKLKVQLGKMD